MIIICSLVQKKRALYTITSFQHYCWDLKKNLWRKWKNNYVWIFFYQIYTFLKPILKPRMCYSDQCYKGVCVYVDLDGTDLDQLRCGHVFADHSDPARVLHIHVLVTATCVSLMHDDWISMHGCAYYRCR